MTTPARSRSTSSLALVVLALAGATGCPGPAPTPTAPAAASAPRDTEAAPKTQVAGPAKPNTAPVGIACALSDGGATVTLTAQGRLDDVTVRVWGARGLTLTGVEGPAPGADWTPGQTVVVSVRFAPAPPGASLAVSVEGVTQGQRRTRTVSFACGALTSAAKPTTSDPSTGRALRVLPAK